MDQKEKELYTQLLEKLNRAEKKAKYYESLLQRNGISYAFNYAEEKMVNEPKLETEIRSESTNTARIPVYEPITNQHIALFRSIFKGREEFYAKRTQYKTYTRPCWNRYEQNGLCPKQRESKFQCKNCNHQAFKQLTNETIYSHLNGAREDGSDVIGIYPITSRNTCWFLVFDFDDKNHASSYETASHNEEVTGKDTSFWKDVFALASICKTFSVPYLIERSRSGLGAHLWIFFDQEIPCADARAFGNHLLTEGMKSVNLTSFRTYDRMMPMQDVLEDNQAGNLIALPLQGAALRKGNSAFVDDSGNCYSKQWDILRNLQRYSKENLYRRLKEWQSNNPYGECNALFSDGDPTNPWDNDQTSLQLTDIQGEAEIVLANGIYVNKDNLKPRFQNRVRRLALYRNPEYFKAKKRNMEISNLKNPYYIYCGRDIQNYIYLPRGCDEALYSALKDGGITYNLRREYCKPRDLNVSFKGTLRQNQIDAIHSLRNTSCGIISAATAFGKTVVGAALIGERKVNTLILVNRSEILDGWYETLAEFLEINEELPTYQTPTGKVRQRSSCIGRYGAGKKELNGLIDIAMIQSLVDKGSVKKDVADTIKRYGMVIADECHHVAGDEYQAILSAVMAPYVYGFTATPKRYDSQDQKMYFQLGRIRYRFSAKDRALEQNIDHLIYPRFTASVNPGKDSNDYNKMLDLLTDDKSRNQLIVSDVQNCLSQHRTPIILTKRIKHALILYELLKDKADHVFCLSGVKTVKEAKALLEERKKVPDHESVILISTGSKAGEGFNYPRLDTLMLVAPISWEGSIEQYTGRLNRDYATKKNVIVFDYVDSGIPMFERMYRKRLSTYRQIGFDVCAAMEENVQKNVIYDGETFLKDFIHDVQTAKESAAIFSPYLSGHTCSTFAKCVDETLRRGIVIHIITTSPDAMDSEYVDGQSKKIKLLQSHGIWVSTVNNKKFDVNYAIIDKRIVWYGNMNLLGKSDEDNDVIRFDNVETASELLKYGMIRSGLRKVSHGLQTRLEL